MLLLWSVYKKLSGGLVGSWLILVTMKILLVFTVMCFLHCHATSLVQTEQQMELNSRPIVGILAQEQSYQLKDKYPENFTSYIAASYVKDVEASGARVVPIMIGKDRSYYAELMSKINGVLFPGGATYFNQSDGYADAGQHIYEIAQELNDNGDYFPVFGTCLGYELLMILASGRSEVENRANCSSKRNMPLHFTHDFRDSKMYRKAEEDVITWLANENITVNYHQFCILDKNMEAYNLTKDWRITSHSDDDNGLEFIASVEHRRYPIYGVQFHPEKIPFEWNNQYPHSYKALKANRHFMDFFVSECRKNLHAFATKTEENQHLIYNYQPRFTGLVSSYEQCYFFEPRSADG
ncbi:gamma-glutamyl hydrolase A-like isoform X1 [Plodia interpunctella]|uniref:gamma-glutamyl hydrolase A-like isoform X1 n=1 Tax=Plodia interpunctella TaxID=58824 RepID=UPI0023684790|nr:gamma-glutamyl hydrolase A-like isoform X1 [Plodia interpunctella]